MSSEISPTRPGPRAFADDIENSLDRLARWWSPRRVLPRCHAGSQLQIPRLKADLPRRLRPTRATSRQLRLFCYSAPVSYVLTMTDRGVVTLPAKLRRELGLAPNQPLLAEVTGDGVLLRPAATLPIEIYSAERIEEFDQAEADLARVLAQEGS